MEFHKNQTDISDNIIGDLEFRHSVKLDDRRSVYESLKAFLKNLSWRHLNHDREMSQDSKQKNLKHSNCFRIKDIIPKFHTQDFIIEILENGKLALSYKENAYFRSYDDVQLVLINPDLSIYHTFKYNIANCEFIGFGNSTNKNKIALFYNYKKTYLNMPVYLKVLPICLNLILI